MCWTWPASFTVSGKKNAVLKALWEEQFKKRKLQILWCGSLLLCRKVSRFVWIYLPSCAYISTIPWYSRLTIRNSWWINFYGCLNSIPVMLTTMTKYNPMASYLFVTELWSQWRLTWSQDRKLLLRPEPWAFLEHAVVCHTWVPLLCWERCPMDTCFRIYITPGCVPSCKSTLCLCFSY